jgi:long-subunit acyl-CoA synthetase (AMP-forming)
MSGLLKRLEFIANLMPKDTVALSSSCRQLSYAALIIEVKAYVQWLRKIDAKVVALQAGNSIEWVLIDIACQELGLVFIPLPAFFTVNQIEKCIVNAGVDTLLSDCKILPDNLNTSFNFVASNHLCISSHIYTWSIVGNSEKQLPVTTQKITFTSGSTGNPKGVCLSADHQWLVAQSLSDVIDIKKPKHLCLLPLSTLLENIAGVYTPLLSGGEVVVPSDNERGLLGSSQLDVSALLGCISDIQPATMILVPQLLTLLAEACMQGWQPPATLKFIAVGGGKVSSQLIEQARDLRLPVYQGYGLSECGSVVALNTPKQDDINSVGQLLPHCQVTVEDNEIVVSGAVHLGYLNDARHEFPEKIYTGDIGSLANGFLSIDGRKKNILISSFGRNISPEWVESVLTSAPMFNHCVVFGDAQSYLIAVVSAPAVVSDSDIAAWIERCNKTLPDYAKVGDWLRVTGDVIKPLITANGRPQREKIYQTFAEQIHRLYVDERISARVG